MVVKNRYDEGGRLVQAEFFSPPDHFLLRRVYRFENPDCPYAADGEMYRADGELSARISRECNDKGQVVRTIHKDLSGQLKRQETYLYDEKDRWIGVSVENASDGALQMASRMDFVRNERGWCRRFEPPRPMARWRLRGTTTAA
jgi:hypothetical protein